MLIRIFITAAICAFYLTVPIDLRRCEDVSVRNTVEELVQFVSGCNRIYGYLDIALIERTNTSSFENVSFPELTEITGFLLLYRIHGLTSIGKLFPNLTVIRGLTLFRDYSLVMYEIRDLEEIGLYSLRSIARGSTRIERCSRLCYVYTIDWGKIGNELHELDYFDEPDEQEFCEGCPKHCEGNCWNSNYCQEIASPYKCHPECIGCTTSNNPRECIACKSYNNTGECVEKCPKDKLHHSLSASCLTKAQCLAMYPNTWWIINKECTNECPPGYMRPEKKRPPNCVKCDSYCPKVCSSGEIDSVSSARIFHGCTVIDGSLFLRVNSISVVQELEKNLELIEEIKGYLKIYRSSTLTSLEFFKKLRLIRGSELYSNRYALAVYENPNLYKLWNWTNFKLKIKKGAMMFHYNSQLCLLEIEKLSNLTGMNYTNFEVSPYSNGDKRECIHIDLRVKITKLTATNITLEWKEFVTEDKNTTAIGYFLYYVQDPDLNTTVYGEQDECSQNGWESIFIVNKTKHQIVNLNPFTWYSFYIKTYTTAPLLDGQTTIRHFKTLSDDPSELINVETTSESSDSINVTWIPPAFPSGELNHYKIVIYNVEDDENFVSHRNYCQYSHNYEGNITLPPIEVSSYNSHLMNITNDDPCCKKQNTKEFITQSFDFNCAVTLSGKEFGICENYIYSTNDNVSGSDGHDIVLQDNHRLRKRSTTYDFPTNSTDLMEKTVLGNETSYVLNELEHFRLYTIYIKACNKEEDEQCGPRVMAFQRTLKKESADDIPSDIITDIDGFSVSLKWSEPKEPNAFIVSYHIEHQRIDLEHSKTLTECITRLEFVANGNKYLIKNFLPGKYSLRVRAVSLAGPGKFTKYVQFEISLPTSAHSIALAVIIIIIVLILLGAFYYYRYYHGKRDIDHQRLLPSGSSDYNGPIYVEDDWEINREDVEMCNEIGKGSFGMVYTGFIKSHNCPCAIKTVNQQVNINEKIIFLNEASVMKAFSNAHHVVKLLGVVSKGHPPLVVMELMARGDLKSFLRKTRSSSNKMTCMEMYRMSTEIADGMMYLSAKKFVHRDLAARNCMVSADHTVKIGDFGMTRDIYAADYYREESGGLMPVRWMSPESLADGVFTTDSDVWSYGVLLWEIVTFAELPYQGLTNEQVLQFVIAQGTLERPPECPDLLYEIMVACWKWQPNGRPTFIDIVEKLESHIGQHFRFVSFYHSAEGEEYKMNAKERVYNVPALSFPFNRNTAIYWNAFDDDISI